MAAALLAGLAALTCAGPATADPAPGLERFYHQRPAWTGCADPVLDRAGARCALVTVPLDYGRPDGRTTTVAISRIAATDPARRRGILLSNPGGPGAPGLRMMANVEARFSPDVRARYDLIGMDPRGIGRSDPVRCALPLPTLLFSAGFDLAGFARDTLVAGAFAASCLALDPDKARHATTRDIARDMDLIRAVLGEPALNYYGFSYGTYLGSVYTQMFPTHSGRFVLDSAIDPDRYWIGMFQDMGPANEVGFDDWAGWAARHDDVYHFGATAPAVRAFVTDLVHRAAAHPLVGGGYLVDEHTVPMMLLALLPNPQWNATLASAIRTVADGVSGKPVDLAGLRAAIDTADPLQPAGMAAILCGDRSAPRDPSWYYRNIERARVRQPLFGAFANNITACAFWPDPPEPPTLVRNPAPALIVQAGRDTRAAYPEGLALHRDLPNSRLITLADTRIHGAFRVGLSQCVNSAVNAYLADGTRPAADLTCAADPAFFPR